MAPTDLSPEIVYLTGKRVMALPFDPALLDRFIAEYHVQYLVTSNEFFQRYASPAMDKYKGTLTTRFVVEHQERYKLVQVVRDTYPAFYPPLEYYVFRVENPTQP